MRNHLVRSTLFAALAAALAAVPHLARAQGGPLVGAGGGVSGVAETGADVSRVGFGIHLRAGWVVSRSIAVVLESNLDGLGGIRQDSLFIGQDPDIDPSTSRQLGTTSLLASVQLGDPSGFYVRPGVGIARHAFTVTAPRSGDVRFAETHHEWGPAAGLAVGREVRVIPGFPLALEAVVHWSGGEDSTGARWTGGLQVVREIRF